MKGEEKLWHILNDKLEMLRASNRLPEAVRVAETALDLAKRAFTDDHASLALSFEKLGLLLDQSGDRVAAKPYLLRPAQIGINLTSRIRPEFSESSPAKCLMNNG